jgi:hypothetical protein
MRYTHRLMAAALFAIASAPASGQSLLDRLKKKAQEAIEQKAEDKVNAKLDAMTTKIVDNSFAALFGDSTAAGTDAGGAGGAGASNGASAGGARATTGASRGVPPFSAVLNAKTEDKYVFSVVVTSEIEATEHGDKGSGKAVLKMHFNPSAAYTGTLIESLDGKRQDATAFAILDAKNKAMVMLMAADKNKFSIAYDWTEAERYAQEQPETAVNWDTVTTWRSFKRIGTKTIAGFATEGFRAEGADGAVEVWVSHDKRLTNGGMFGANSSLKQLRGHIPSEMPQGMPLEMTTNSASGDRLTLRVTNITTSANVTYVMADYPRMMGGKR